MSKTIIFKNNTDTKIKLHSPLKVTIDASSELNLTDNLWIEPSTIKKLNDVSCESPKTLAVTTDGTPLRLDIQYVALFALIFI